MKIGGKPKPGGKPDRRLKTNNPNAGKPKPSKSATKVTPRKGGMTRAD